MQVAADEPWPLPTTELQPALELASALTRADMGVLMLYDDGADALLPAACVGLSDDDRACIGAQRSGAGPFGQAVAERRRVVIRDVPRDAPTFLPLVDRLGIRTMEIQPLIGSSGQTIGALGLMFRQNRTVKKQRAHMVDLSTSLLVSAVMQAQARHAAERQRLEAEQHGRAKVQLMARLSHELRTPLQSIAGYIELLRLGAPEPLTPAQAYLLDRMLDGEQILVHVVDDLITFSRLETGHLSYDLDAVSVNQALRVTEAIVAPLAHARGVALTVSDATRDAQVFGDDAKIKQVLVNLATNAVKFTGQGGQVTLTCRASNDDVVFDISDTGAGIPADQLRAIFEPYVQLPTPLLDSHGGSGLGLAISREFATAMHGELTVSSTLGRGSTFTLRLKRFSPELAAGHQITSGRRLEGEPPLAGQDALMTTIVPTPDSARAPQEH
jgi:signal transduction histidine kinase